MSDINSPPAPPNGVLGALQAEHRLLTQKYQDLLQEQKYREQQLTQANDTIDLKSKRIETLESALATVRQEREDARIECANLKEEAKDRPRRCDLMVETGGVTHAIRPFRPGSYVDVGAGGRMLRVRWLTEAPGLDGRILVQFD